MDKRYEDYYHSIFIMYISRIVSTCEAAFILLEKELFAESRMLLRVAFEASLTLHYLLKNKQFLDKYKEHSIVQKYIELLDIKDRNICKPDLVDEFKADLRKTKRKLLTMTYYKFEKDKITNKKYLIHKIGTTPVKIREIITFIEEDDSDYFKFVFWNEDIKNLELILHSLGSKEIHSYFENVINLSFEANNELFYVWGLMHSALAGLEEINFPISHSHSYGIDISEIRKLWAKIKIAFVPFR